jgi:anti-sigma factor RsiW
MTTRRDFSDQDLSCYLDGEADPALVSDIEAALAEDAALQARLNALRAGQQRFTQALDAALELAPDMPAIPLHPANANRAVSNLKAGLAGIAIGALAALGLTYALAPDAQKSDWINDVAVYQSLYVAETLAAVNLTPQENQAKLAQISRALGFDLTHLPQVSGLTLKRAQQLGYNGRPLAQVTFVNAAGSPVALCVTRTNAPDSTKIRFEMVQGLRAYIWNKNGFGLLLIGPPDDPELEKAAEIYRATL